MAYYVDGFVVPVPKKKKAAYLRMARKGAKIWREHGALEYVECIADDVKKGKPDPSIFRLASDGLKVEPAHILVCEDAVSGVEAAKAAGMKCLAIAANGRGPLLEKAGADRVVPDFSAASLEDLSGLFV